MTLLPVDVQKISTPNRGAGFLVEENHWIRITQPGGLAAYDVVEPQDLGKYPLLLSPQGVAFRDALDDDLKRFGIELTPKAEVDGMRLLESLAADGFGASVLPASATTSAGNWKRVPVRGLAPRVVGLVSNRRVPPSATSRAVRAVLFDVVRTHADEQDGIHPAVE